MRRFCIFRREFNAAVVTKRLYRYIPLRSRADLLNSRPSCILYPLPLLRQYGPNRDTALLTTCSVLLLHVTDTCSSSESTGTSTAGTSARVYSMRQLLRAFSNDKFAEDRFIAAGSHVQPVRTCASSSVWNATASLQLL